MNSKILTAVMLSLLISTPGHGTAATPSDAEITKIITVTNEGEIEISKMAQGRSQNEQVKKFAKEMVVEHTNNNKNSMQLVRKLKLVPEKNPKSEEMKKENEVTLQKIKALEGREFDRAYMDTQISMHQKVLTDLEETLIPNAKHPELKAMLEKTKSAVSKHLGHAKQIQSTIQ